MALVNLKQTPEERRSKYWLVRSLGQTAANAQRQRDWRLAKIERLYNLTIPGQTEDPADSDYRTPSRLARLDQLCQQTAPA